MMVSHYANLKINFEISDNVMPYVSMTEDAIRKFEMADEKISIPGDSSTEAVYRALNIVGNKIYINGLADDNMQPDAEFNNILKAIGSKFESEPEGSYNTAVNIMRDFDIDIEKSVDLIFPALYLAIHNCGVTNIRGIARTAHKESNRILESTKILDKLGIEYNLCANSLTVHSNNNWLKESYKFNSSLDHRCDMLKVMICLETGGEMDEFKSINKSHPSFIQNLIKCGAIIER